jgi:triacylglycerol esterase/lipase EstA (alpha/beta hydrolase family)
VLRGRWAARAPALVLHAHSQGGRTVAYLRSVVATVFLAHACMLLSVVLPVGL